MECSLFSTSCPERDPDRLTEIPRASYHAVCALSFDRLLSPGSGQRLLLLEADAAQDYYAHGRLVEAQTYSAQLGGIADAEGFQRQFKCLKHGLSRLFVGIIIEQ